MSKSRKFFITINYAEGGTWDENEWELLKSTVSAGEYGICAKEVGDKNGIHHLHGYVRYTNPRSWKKIKKLFPRANIQAAKGSDFDQVYLQKEGEYFEHGKPSETTQGQRTDLIEVKDKIMEGASVDDLTVENPMLFHQYGRTLDRLESIALRKRFRTEMTKGLWITGPSGSGKSHQAFEGFSPETHYVKNLNEEWWDGYKGQQTVILNEFRGQITFSELLDLVDKWPKQVKWRGRESVPFLAKLVIVTSVRTPKECYHSLQGKEPWEQFDRRFSVVQKLEQKCPEGNTKPLCQNDEIDYDVEWNF